MDHHPREAEDPQQVFSAIPTTIKSKEHFWHFQDDLSDVHQQHPLSQHLDNGPHQQLQVSPH